MSHHRSHSKLTSRAVRDIRRCRRRGASYRELAERYGVGLTTIAFAERRWTWRWVLLFAVAVLALCLFLALLFS